MFIVEECLKDRRLIRKYLRYSRYCISYAMSADAATDAIRLSHASLLSDVTKRVKTEYFQDMLTDLCKLSFRHDGESQHWIFRQDGTIGSGMDSNHVIDVLDGTMVSMLNLASHFDVIRSAMSFGLLAMLCDSVVNQHLLLTRIVLRADRSTCALCCAHPFTPELLRQKNIYVLF